MDLKPIYHVIDKDMAAVESKLAAMFADCQHDQIVDIGDFLMFAPGKRLRPAMVILAARASSASGGKDIDQLELIDTASAVELIHVASLIHDDIVDCAAMRHNQPSINSKWGNDVSLIFGDYVYAKAFNILSTSRNNGVLTCLSDAIHTMCEGELRQILSRDVSEMSEFSYDSIVEKKTASLFAACCEIGSVLGQQNESIKNAMHHFGMNFGIAFQIADDMRDIVSQKDSLGKQPGQDLSMGEVTLPMMNLYDSVDKDSRDRLNQAIKDDDSVNSIRQMYIESEAPAKTIKVIAEYAEKAKIALAVLEPSQYNSSLALMVDQIVESSLEHV